MASDLKELADCLAIYVTEYPAFRSKPVGAPGSDARKAQEVQIELEDRAKTILRKVSQ